MSKDKFAEYLHKGMMEDIRNKTISRIMTELEKEVIGAVDDAIKNMRGYVAMREDFATRDIQMIVKIDGVQQNV
jgi:hypothetical protein